MDNFRAIRCILCYLEKRCSVKKGYGLTVKRFADGAVAIFGEYPRITLKRLEYLENNL